MVGPSFDQDAKGKAAGKLLLLRVFDVVVFGVNDCSFGLINRIYEPSDLGLCSVGFGICWLGTWVWKAESVFFVFLNDDIPGRKVERSRFTLPFQTNVYIYH